MVEDNYPVEPRSRGVMQMSRVSSYSDCECDQQMQVLDGVNLLWNVIQI